MRTCEKYETLVSAFIDGTLTEGEWERLMEHMASCSACQQYFNDQIAIHDALTALEAEAPEDFTETVMAKVRLTAQNGPEVEKPKKKHIVFPHWRQWAAVAACCAVAALGIWRLSGQRTPEDAALSRSATTYGSVYGYDSGEAAQAPEEQGEDCEALDDSAPPRDSTNRDSASFKQAGGAPEAALTLEPACADNTAAEQDVQRDDRYVTVLSTASPAAADWVEENLGEPWEEYRGYELTEEQYRALLALLEEEGADFTLHPAEAETHWYELRVE